MEPNEFFSPRFDTVLHISVQLQVLLDDDDYGDLVLLLVRCSCSDLDAPDLLTHTVLCYAPDSFAPAKWQNTRGKHYGNYIVLQFSSVKRPTHFAVRWRSDAQRHELSWLRETPARSSAERTSVVCVCSAGWPGDDDNDTRMEMGGGCVDISNLLDKTIPMLHSGIGVECSILCRIECNQVSVRLYDVRWDVLDYIYERGWLYFLLNGKVSETNATHHWISTYDSVGNRFGFSGKNKRAATLKCIHPSWA